MQSEHRCSVTIMAWAGGAGSSGAGELPKQPDDGCPLREISSVMMTSSGFLSPCREGKLPDRQRIHVPQDPDDRKVRPTGLYSN